MIEEEEKESDRELSNTHAAREKNFLLVMHGCVLKTYMLKKSLKSNNFSSKIFGFCGFKALSRNISWLFSQNIFGQVYV